MTRVTLTMLALGLLVFPIAFRADASTMILQLQQGSSAYRIVADDSSNEYWILDWWRGLVLLHEASPGTWDVQYYSIPQAYDIAGPDSNGNIYVTVRSDPPRIDVFDTDSKVVVRSIILNAPYYFRPAGLAVSANEQFLYVSAWSWPAMNEGWNPLDSSSHLDSGRILEIQISSGSVTRSAVVGALPSTIYVTPNDSLLVSTSERFKITDDEGWTLGEEEVVDIVDLSSFQRITRLPCSFSNEEFTQDFVPWDENGSLVAACSPEPEIISTRPTYSDGIWIIDTATNTIVDSYEILDGPYKSGVESLAVSNSCPGEVFVLPSSYDPSTYERVVIIDHSDGAFIGTINVGSPLRPKFICELPDGRLIVTAGASGKIAIVDPT